MVERKVLDVSYEGKPVEEITIRTGKSLAKVLSLGAILSDLQVPDRQGGVRRIVAKMDDVLANVDSPHYGQVIGRFANRITDGKFRLHGKTYQMEKMTMESMRFITEAVILVSINGPSSLSPRMGTP